MPEFEFPTEIIDLPSKGLVYPKESPLSKGQVELKYMTAKEEDILTSQSLIKKGLVLDKLFDSLIVTEGVKSADVSIKDSTPLSIIEPLTISLGTVTCTPVLPINVVDKGGTKFLSPVVKPSKNMF